MAELPHTTISVLTVLDIASRPAMMIDYTEGDLRCRYVYHREIGWTFVIAISVSITNAKNEVEALVPVDHLLDRLLTELENPGLTEKGCAGSRLKGK